LAVDCYYFPKDTEIAGHPCDEDADCVTHNLCIKSWCHKPSMTCQTSVAGEGESCSLGGTCDANARCCLPL
jgi:hypothetical protein